MTIARDGSGVATVSGASSIAVAGGEVVLARLAGSFGQLSVSGNSNDAVWERGTARAPVAGSGDWPAWTASVSRWGYLGAAI